MPDVVDYDGYFFDLDGTVILGNRLLPGVKETLSVLRSKGKKVLFLSNTTTRTREQCRLRLQSLGIEAHPDEIVTAAFAAAVYMREQPEAPSVLAIGEPALAAELELQGIRLAAEPEQATHVLVGMDMGFDYGKLHAAAKAIRQGAKLIAANPDPTCPVEDGVIPDTGAIVKAVEAAGGVAAAAIIGKPSAYYASKVLEVSGLRAERCLMIGDRLETDVLFGLDNGLHTALVLTGVASADEAERSPIRPHYVWRTLEQFPALLPAKP